MTRRLPAIDPDTASPDVRSALLEGESRRGLGTDIMRTMANSPAAVKGYLALDSALRAGCLGLSLRQQIALAVAEVNICRDCVHEHIAAARASGVDEATIKAARHGSSSDPKVEAALQFAQKVAEYRGDLTDDEFDRVRRAGYSDEDIAEILANVVLSIYTTFFETSSSDREWTGS